MGVSEVRHKLNLSFARELASHYVVPEVPTENLEALNSKRLIKKLMAFASDLGLYFSIRYAFGQWQARAKKAKQIPPPS